MFAITSNKGFHLQFKNGWTASVQFGPGNYCDNYNEPIGAERNANFRNKPSSTAEVAAYKGDDGPLEQLGNGDTVEGYVTADEVLKFLNIVATCPETLGEWQKLENE